jgi:hypothetical protein
MQHGVAPPPVSMTGRARGQPNFKGDEDIKLAPAYVLVSTNAAIGTDQDGNTFWNKIWESFVKSGGGDDRTANSLQNRFNKVLQLEVQKFIGFFHGALREYHSGWVMDDYVKEAKRLFQARLKNVFKHELVYDVLKRLPKYELVLEGIHPQTARAL